VRTYIIILALFSLMFISGCVATDTFYIAREINLEKVGFSSNRFNVNVSIENKFRDPILIKIITIEFDETQFTCPIKEREMNLAILGNEKKIFRFENCQTLNSALPGKFLIKGGFTYTSTQNNVLQIEGSPIMVNTDQSISIPRN